MLIVSVFQCFLYSIKGKLTYTHYPRAAFHPDDSELTLQSVGKKEIKTIVLEGE